jgi:D-alanyl-D-alanine carboxypeptidase/D-alanyl-D-alanine-endopeptidase (penicillin-binding protein 4)
MNWQGFDIENGSGLSRKARISPRQMGELLRYAWDSPIMPELMSSLPIAGVDGTMRKRLRGQPARGMIHLKTGTLKDVRAGAGYMITESGRRYVIVIMQNEPNVQNGGGSRVQDALLDWLYHNGSAELPLINDSDSMNPNGPKRMRFSKARDRIFPMGALLC